MENFASNLHPCFVFLPYIIYRSSLVAHGGKLLIAFLADDSVYDGSRRAFKQPLVSIYKWVWKSWNIKYLQILDLFQQNAKNVNKTYHNHNLAMLKYILLECKTWFLHIFSAFVGRFARKNSIIPCWFSEQVVMRHSFAVICCLRRAWADCLGNNLHPFVPRCIS